MEQTFNTIYKENYTKVLNWCKFRVGDAEVAEELTSDIFMKIHKNLTNFDSQKSNMNTWVMNITKNSIIDFWRTNKTGVMVSTSDFVDDEGNENFFIADNTTPQTLAENNELSQAINNAIASLPITYQLVAERFFLQEKSHEEIVNELDLPMGTVKATIFRAKKMLQKKLSNF
jgi:RNA polymerase sigma-70 factor (ECF subfamily)